MRAFCFLLSIMTGACTWTLVQAIRELVCDYKNETDSELRRINKFIIVLFSIILLGVGFLFCLFLVGSVAQWQ